MEVLGAVSVRVPTDASVRVDAALLFGEIDDRCFRFGALVAQRLSGDGEPLSGAVTINAQNQSTQPAIAYSAGANRYLVIWDAGPISDTLTSASPLKGPFVFSEVYGPKNHWDLEFIFVGERDQVGQHPVWRELSFVDVNATPREEIARYHEDILAHVGRWNPARG